MKGTKWMILLCAAMLSCGMTVSAAPFDPAYYAAQNPDVVQAVGEDEAALELHYSTFGVAEGRAANAQEAAARNAKTPVSFEEFDPAYYAEQNPDVTALLGTDPAALYAHYVMFGAAEGRLPKAPEVVDPYARFASSDTGSRSSRHSDDDDDDEDNSGSAGSGSSAGSSGSSGSGSGSAQTHIVYEDPSQYQYEMDTNSVDYHCEYRCSLNKNCTAPHREYKPCSGTVTSVDDDYHHIKCDKCGRDQNAPHDISINADKATWTHYRMCTHPDCNYKRGRVESCVFVAAEPSNVCREKCETCKQIRKYTHKDTDWNDDGSCKRSDACEATKNNPTP